ncbi:response regulator transcription factor [Sphingobium sp.]|uniref:response regulator transcription factor n=1 Tax=Sphingobium sp. TaxID=1912891 RepID=UPI002C13B5B8|nr:response regulator transcription factor [Sphingobium sp.]HUD91658.1 response regulator transcription factor [Sphingobium sp.]
MRPLFTILHDVLIVEDDMQLAESLSSRLRSVGHAVTVLTDGQEALDAVIEGNFDVIVLGLVLRGLDGLAVVRSLREGGITTPVIMMAAFADSAERIVGLDGGADDYMVKPVNVDELHARINAVMRRANWSTDGHGTVGTGDITVSPGRLRAWYRGVGLDLSVQEFRLLAQLVRNADSVLSRETLYETVWRSDTAPSSKVVDAHVSRIRRRMLEQVGFDPIVTVRGAGYMVRK